MMEKIVLFFRYRDAIILAIVAIVLSITSAKAELKILSLVNPIINSFSESCLCNVLEKEVPLLKSPLIDNS